MQTKLTIQPAGSPGPECIPEAASVAGRPNPATTALARLLLWGDAVTAAQRMPSRARPSACEGRVNRAGLRRGAAGARAGRR
jgi:hypothetical protein